MAEEQREDISHLESKVSTVKCENEEDCDLSVITVIEKNQPIVSEELEVKAAEEIGDGGFQAIDNVKTEVILLDEAPAANISRNIVRNSENRRVIELSDTISKMELRRQFKVDVASREVVTDAPATTNERNKNLAAADDDDDGSAEILSRLPPGTILIKQNNNNNNNNNATTRNCGQEDSDYVHESSKDSAESNSSESSSATSYNATAGKIKRMQHRNARSKKIVEVRRNPVRNKKKKPIDEDFLRPRQRLLSVKRKAGFVVDPVTRKRAKTAPVPYMNTRSVTRKMYTVGATYQAPTIHDAIEWKEWPAHGMNERPVWHPQFGLAYGYNDRHYLSLDDRTYREIIDEPVIEVVSVDPNPERVLLAGNKRKYERIRPNNSSDNLNICDNELSTGISNEKSFEACMHGSLHSVLAYCAQVVTPNYKNTIDTKLKKITQSSDISSSKKSAGTSRILPDVAKSLQNEKKICTHSLPAQAASLNKISRTSISQTANSTSSDVPKCLVVPRRTISFTNVRNIQGNILQEVFGRASKNTLIFLKPTDPPVKPEKICTTTKAVPAKLAPTSVENPSESTTEELNSAKLEDDAINDEKVMEMSIHKKLLTSEEIETTVKNDDEIKLPITAIVATKIPKKSPSPKAKEIQPPNGIRTSSAEALNQESSGTKNVEINRTLRPANSNQAAEIAKILAEYNQKAAKNPATKSTCYPSANVLNARAINSKLVKTEKDCSNNQGSRTTFLSVVEQPKRIKKIEDLGKKTYRGCNAFVKQENNANLSSTTDIAVKNNISIKNEETGKIGDDNSRAMDLSTGKFRESEVLGQPEIKAEETMNRQWLQELIEDTAILYCAAAGVRQDDVVNYLDTLDSSQSLEWLGS